jgi:hypothetical protein
LFSVEKNNWYELHHENGNELGWYKISRKDQTIDQRLYKEMQNLETSDAYWNAPANQ